MLPTVSSQMIKEKRLFPPGGRGYWWVRGHPFAFFFQSGAFLLHLCFCKYLCWFGGRACQSDGDAVENNWVVSSEPQKPRKRDVDGGTRASRGWHPRNLEQVCAGCRARIVCVNMWDPRFAFLYLLIANQKRDRTDIRLEYFEWVHSSA